MSKNRFPSTHRVVALLVLMGLFLWILVAAFAVMIYQAMPELAPWVYAGAIFFVAALVLLPRRAP